ncbi:tetratricopeptide repeat protein [Thiomicrorhabdus sp. 6S2-11]|uniref:Ancillary SecYEG translocon subunit n=1 Tax=Thiomicrorhabdus marina TaxID=2818442 RepID=A0ABS3Q6N3_9GAMM|nr:tetratricopeptide repeat protein [Thiomicrorhabdus marina]MBO1927728.1 tetratricopeptide repeat protein [Thiomicrorhabdus marina]
MSRYETEEEQIDAIKSWWKKNGTALLSAVLVVVLAFSGWRYWTNSQYVEKANASGTFEALQINAERGSFGEVSREALKLMQESPQSPYAAAAALMYAKFELDNGKVENAIEKFEWVQQNATDAELKAVAQLRLARLYLDQKDFDKAQSTLDSLAKAKLSAGQKANMDYTLGVLALLKQENDAARSAFKSVTDNDSADDTLRGLAQIQLDDLAQ